MNWDTAGRYDIWAAPISNREAKEKMGRQLAENVRDGQVIGVGSGSSSYVALHAIAERVQREHLRISAVCTSPEIALACAALAVPVASLLQSRPDWYFDGADEVDGAKNLLKGRGGAMFMEKIVMAASPKTFILVDSSKLVARLGTKFPIPVEVFPAALHVAESELDKLGATEVSLRLAVKKDGPVITEGGNFILDVRFREIYDTLERDIKAIAGVIESGLFMGRTVEIVTVPAA